MHTDPGFYADWHFVENIVVRGDGICPVAGVLTAAHGTLHDDERSGVDCTHSCNSGGNCGVMQYGTCQAGYADHANCYTTIHNPDDDGQVKFTFTQMNLELTGCHPNAGPGQGCPEGGCDYVALYDGSDESAPLLGKFSGQPSNLPVVVSSGQDLHIRFITDTSNCGIAAAGQVGDPGWFADWDFVENGQDICHPDAAVLTDPHGVLHDDGTGASVDCSVSDCSHNDAGAGVNGYDSNLDCGVRIRGPRGSTVNLHISAMNLEGPHTGTCSRQNPARPDWCECDPMEDADCFDYVEVRDGRNANAPLLARVSDDITDAINSHDTWTSTGRNMFVKFHTDGGNGGLSLGCTDGVYTCPHGDPGFYAEWQIIDNGQACEHFTMLPDTAIRGHNNEQLRDVTVQQCEEACCARAWCKSFDYTDTDNHCNLADIDASRQFGETTSAGNWVLYERPESSIAMLQPALGPSGCEQMLQDMSNDINDVCCGGHGEQCSDGAPRVCTEECATVWMPFAKQCSLWLSDNMGGSHLNDVTEGCERQQFGRYKPGKRRGRCNDDDLAEFFAQLSPACCGGDGEFCPDLEGAGIGANGGITLPTPMQNGAPVCLPECGQLYEEFYSECHPRLENDAPGADIVGFLRLCQGIPPPAGGGHRREMSDVEEPDV